MASCNRPIVEDDELYSPASPLVVWGETEVNYSGKSESATSDAYRLQHDDSISPKTIPTESKATAIDELISRIYKPDGEIDYHTWAQSGIPIPASWPAQHIARQLLAAKIAGARFHVARLVLRVLKPSAATEKEALESKERALEEMLSHARRVVDTAGQLRRPDLQAQGFYYLALAAEDDGNEALAESHFERALEARGSWESKRAAEALGIDVGESEGIQAGQIASESTLFSGGMTKRTAKRRVHLWGL